MNTIPQAKKSNNDPSINTIARPEEAMDNPIFASVMVHGASALDPFIHQQAYLHWLHHPHPSKRIQKGFPAFMTLQIHIKLLCVLSHYNLYSGRVYKLSNTDYTPPNLHRIHDSLVLRLHFSHSQEKWVW